MGGQNIYSVIAVVVSVVLTALLTYATTRANSRKTARDAAEQTEITVRAQFLVDQSKRISELEGRLDQFGRREREMIERFRSDMESLDARWRHLTNNLVMHVQLLIFRLRRHDIEVPEFKGWDQFIAEGGNVRREWAESWEPSPMRSRPTEKPSDDSGGG